MDNNAYERQIDLKDLIFAVFKKWRPIIIVAIILGGASAGYKCGEELMHQKDEEYVTGLEEQYNNDIDKYEQMKKVYESDVENFTVSISYQEKYKENSILLKIDPYNKGTAAVDVFVKMPDVSKVNGIVLTSVDPSDSVVKAYASAIQQGGALSRLAKQKGIDLIYLKELVQVTTDYDSNMFNVTVTYTDEAGAKEILNIINDNIKSMHGEIEENLGNHSLAIMNQDIGVVTDQALAEYQKKKVEDLTTTNQNLKDTEKKLKDLEKPEQPVALSNGSILKEVIKYGILGGGVGGFIVAFVVCLGFIFNGKLNSDNELKNRYRIKLLGSYTEKGRRRPFSGIDVWLEKLEGKESIADELVYEMIAAKISNFTEKGDSIYLTGTVGQNALENLNNVLRVKLDKDDIKFGTDLVRNVSTLRSISECDKIILVEKRNQSKTRDIEQEMEIIYNMHKEVIGYIIL
jgi:capsular polysaccharide biosynthesis protein